MGRAAGSGAHQQQESVKPFDRHYRPHWALVPETGGDPYVPTEVYQQRLPTQLPRWQGWAKHAKKELDDLMQLQDAA